MCDNVPTGVRIGKYAENSFTLELSAFKKHFTPSSSVFPRIKRANTNSGSCT
jgi:hypothetical protein